MPGVSLGLTLAGTHLRAVWVWAGLTHVLLFAGLWFGTGTTQLLTGCWRWLKLWRGKEGASWSSWLATAMQKSLCHQHVTVPRAFFTLEQQGHYTCPKGVGPQLWPYSQQSNLTPVWRWHPHYQPQGLPQALHPNQHGLMSPKEPPVSTGGSAGGGDVMFLSSLPMTDG